MCKKFEFGGNSHGDATIFIPGPFAPGVCGVPQGAAGEASWQMIGFQKEFVDCVVP